MSSPTPSSLLRWERGEQAGWVRLGPEGALIGRATDCDVVLPSEDVSRRHARIEFDGDRWLVRDLGSANGTWIGEAAVAQHELADGERVRIGEYELTFRSGDAQHGSLEPSEDLEPAAQVDMGDFDALVSNVLGPQAPAVSAARGAVGSDAALRIVQVMHAAMSALLEHDDFDVTLERVVTLVFAHVPAERCIVLLYDPQTDQLTPRLERAAPGSNLENLRISRSIARNVLETRQSVLVRDAATDLRFAAAESIVSLGIRSAMCAPLCHLGRVGGLVYVDRTAHDNAFTPADLGLLSILAAISAAALERARMRSTLEYERRLRERLERYHAPNVVDHIVATAELAGGAMATEERAVSVLFADIVGFTHFAERLPPREVTSVLNQVFELLTDEVFEQGGTLDKFLGDGLMAFFGAPLPQSDHALRAVRAARGMLASIAAFNSGRPAEQRLELRVGVNTGPVVVGDIGARRRRDYTVIGDAVNVASRLESGVARPGELVIGAQTQAEVAQAFECEPLAPVVLKGRTTPFQCYRVLGEAAARS